jgi:hypothetical protein
LTEENFFNRSLFQQYQLFISPQISFVSFSTGHRSGMGPGKATQGQYAPVFEIGDQTKIPFPMQVGVLSTHDRG